jgi:hypothetical protein
MRLPSPAAGTIAVVMLFRVFMTNQKEKGTPYRVTTSSPSASQVPPINRL